jgi:hypothetical protein
VKRWRIHEDYDSFFANSGIRFTGSFVGHSETYEICINLETCKDYCFKTMPGYKWAIEERDDTEDIISIYGHLEECPDGDTIFYAGLPENETWSIPYSENILKISENAFVCCIATVHICQIIQLIIMPKVYFRRTSNIVYTLYLIYDLGCVTEMCWDFHQPVGIEDLFQFLYDSFITFYEYWIVNILAWFHCFLLLAEYPMLHFHVKVLKYFILNFIIIQLVGLPLTIGFVIGIFSLFENAMDIRTILSSAFKSNFATLSKYESWTRDILVGTFIVYILVIMNHGSSLTNIPQLQTESERQRLLLMVENVDYIDQLFSVLRKGICRSCGLKFKLQLRPYDPSDKKVVSSLHFIQINN